MTEQELAQLDADVFWLEIKEPNERIYQYHPTRDPAEAMRLLEKHGLTVAGSEAGPDGKRVFLAWRGNLIDMENGETPCIAICRAVVALHESKPR